MSKPLRQAMPTIAAFVDDLRAAFGDAMINDAIRAGLDGQGTFWARENGHTVGSLPRAGGERPEEAKRCVLCVRFSRPGLSAGYCGTDNGQAPAYGPGHPLRQLPADLGATCSTFDRA